MSLTDKTASEQPTSFNPGLVPDIPRAVPNLLDVPGFVEQDRRYQEWWSSVRQQLFETIQQDGINISRNGASIREEAEIRETADGYLSGKYTLQVTAGSVVTGMVITSSEAEDGGTVSEVTFQTDRFKIYNGTTGKIMFDASGSDVRIGGTLVVDTASQRLFIGAGNFSNADTAFYINGSTGNLSLKDRLVWNSASSLLTISGRIVLSQTANQSTAGLYIGNDFMGYYNGASYITYMDNSGNFFLGGASGNFRWTSGTSTLLITGTSNVAIGGSGQVSGFASNMQVINSSGSTNEVQNFAFGSGTPNFTGLVAGGTQASPSGATSGRLMKIKLVTYGDSGGGWITGGNASIWLRTTQNHNNTDRGTEIEFRTTPNASISEQVVMLLGQDRKVYIGGSSDTCVYRGGADILQTDDDFYIGNSSTQRWLYFPNGGNIQWGSGGVIDTNLYRSSANILKTDDSFSASGYIEVGGGTTNNVRTSSGRLYMAPAGTNRWFFSDSGNLVSMGGSVVKETSDAWTPKLSDGSATIEFQASGGQIYGRINGGAAILLG